MLPGARHAEAGVPAVIVKHDGHVLLLGAGALPLHPPRLQRTLRPQPRHRPRLVSFRLPRTLLVSGILVTTHLTTAWQI